MAEVIVWFDDGPSDSSNAIDELEMAVVVASRNVCLKYFTNGKNLVQ